MTCLLTLFVSATNAQSGTTDSLLHEIYKATSNTHRLDLILALCRRNDTHIDTFSKYAFIARTLADRSDDPVKKAYVEYYVALVYYYANNNDSARIVTDDALKILPHATMDERRIYYKLKGFKATTYQGQRRNAEALQILYPLLTEAEKNNDSIFIAQTRHQIALIEGQQTNPQKLIAWEQKALQALPTKDENSNIVLATIYATLGKAYMQLDKDDSATWYHLKAIDIFKKEEDVYNLAVVLQRQANVFINQKKPAPARQILDELSALNSQTKMGEGDVNYYLSFINYYLLTGSYDKVIKMCNAHLYGKDASSNESIRLSYLRALSDAYKAKGDFGHYTVAVDELLAAKDSFYKNNSAEAIAEVETKYDVQKKENLIIQQKYDIATKNFLFYGLLGVLGLGGIIGWLLFKNYQRRSKMKLFLVQEEEKRLSLQAVKDAEEKERKRIAADLHDSLGSYAASIQANVDEMMKDTSHSWSNLDLLQSNSRQMVSLLGDTIWALRKERLKLSDISDKVKVFLQRLKPNYPKVHMHVEEHLAYDIELQPNHAYHLFMIVQEAVNNSLKHSGGNEITVAINGGENWFISICDNGKGMENVKPSLDGGNGRYNMQVRAETAESRIEWVTAPMQGTKVIIRANTF